MNACCPQCSSTSMVHEDSLGITYCNECGTLLEDRQLVSAVTFTTSKSLEGQTHRITDTIAKVNNRYISLTNTQIIHQIKSICANMGLSDTVAECAFRWYKLSLEYNLSKGKGILYTLSALIYIVCRQEKMPHLLIDFSVALKIDVFKIGRVFLKAVRLLKINIPLVDPVLYIERYAHKLHLREKKIINLSNRLIRRMERDFIVCGRRPNNICGAALLISSRIFGKPRSISLVANITNTTTVTIGKRLKEIKALQSTRVTVEDFLGQWGLTEAEISVASPEELSEDYAKSKLNSGGNIPLMENIQFALHKVNTPTEEVVVDDVEIDTYILNDDEITQREKVWDDLYGDFINEREQKRRVRENTLPKKKKRRRLIFTSVEESINSVIKENNLSRKIDYEALKEFFD